MSNGYAVSNGYAAKAGTLRKQVRCESRYDVGENSIGDSSGDDSTRLLTT